MKHEGYSVPKKTEQPKTEERLPAVVDEKATIAAGFATSNYARLVNLFGYGLWSDEPGPLDIETAIKLSTFCAGLDVISQDIAKVPLHLREKLPNGGSRVVEPDEHWLAEMLALDPNEHHTWQEFFEMLILHLGAVQNAFIGKKMDRRGRVEELIPFLPGRVRILVDDQSWQYVYDIERITPHEYLLLKDFERYLLPSEVIHLRGRMFDGLWGYSNLDAGSGAMGMAKALQDFQTRLYRSDAALRGVFQMNNEKTLSEEAFRRLRDQLGELWKKVKDQGRPIVLEEGMEFKGISMDAGEAETAKAKEAAVEDVVRYLRVPAYKIGHLGAVKYENLDTLSKDYAQDCLIPIAGKVEKKLNRSLLTAKERLAFYLEFDREAMVLTDIDKQATIMKVMLNNGAMTLNEARMKRGMNPLPSEVGDVRLVPANYHLVNAKGEVVLQAGNQQGTDANNGGGDEGETGKSADPGIDDMIEVRPELRIVQ